MSCRYAPGLCLSKPVSWQPSAPRLCLACAVGASVGSRQVEGIHHSFYGALAGDFFTGFLHLQPQFVTRNDAPLVGTGFWSKRDQKQPLEGAFDHLHKLFRFLLDRFRGRFSCRAGRRLFTPRSLLTFWLFFRVFCHSLALFCFLSSPSPPSQGPEPYRPHNMELDEQRKAFGVEKWPFTTARN
jgi:hypothetical protein